jgi:mono/diheme cytochrome c family protein
LGVSTRQLNRPVLYPSGVRDQQLRTWNHLGLFDAQLDERTIATLPHLVALDDPQAGAEQRVRSYLDANCSFCHRPSGVGFSNFDARADIPLAETNLIGGQVVIDHGIDRARNLAPQDPWRSMLLIRMETNAELRMPPLARNCIDERAVAAVRSWIDQLPGKPGLAPPQITPAPGQFSAPVQVSFSHPDPQVTLHYTLDGSTPDSRSDSYDAPLTIASPTTVRVRAYKIGHVSSVVVNGTFIIDAK